MRKRNRKTIRESSFDFTQDYPEQGRMGRNLPRRQGGPLTVTDIYYMSSCRLLTCRLVTCTIKKSS